MKDFEQRKNTLFNICLVGILMSLTIVVKVIFNFIPVLNGYPLDFYIAFFVLAILMIKSYTYKWIFLLITPWVLLIIPSGFVSFGDLMLEYILPLYIFFPIIYFSFIMNLLTKKVNNKKIKLILELITLSFLILVLFTIKFLFHIIAGYIWYTPGDWYASMVINAEIVFLIYIVDIPIILLSYPSLTKIYSSFYDKTKSRQKDSDTCIQV